MTNQHQNRKGPALSNKLAALEQRLGPIEYRPIASLKRFENNPRQHPEKQLVKLEASIREFSFTAPVLIDENDMIIAGEGRVEAGRRAGLTEVPVIVAHHWSAAQVRAYRLADNRLAELASWDKEALAIELAAIIEFDESPIEVLGWETAEIDLILDDAEVSDAGGSSTDPAMSSLRLRRTPSPAKGDLWQLGPHRLLCGSEPRCRELGSPAQRGDRRDGVHGFAVQCPGRGHVCGLGKVQHQEFAMASGEMSKPEFIAFLTDSSARCCHT